MTAEQRANAYKLAYESLRDHVLQELASAEKAIGKDEVFSRDWERVHAWRMAACPISVLDEHVKRFGS